MNEDHLTAGRGRTNKPQGGRTTIIVDSRERTPFLFEGAVHKALPAGDYSVLGLEDRVSIERKKVSEMFKCAGVDRRRFERELEKLSRYEYAAIVIEGSLSHLLMPSRFSRVSPRTVINSLLSWSVRYGVHVFFAESRELAQQLTYRLLEKFVKYSLKKESHGMEQR